MGNENEDIESKDLNSENIFDEFTDTQDIQDEVAKVETRQEKDMYYYIKKFSSVFFTINMLLGITILLWMGYIYIQEGETKKEYAFLSPICHVFLWDNSIFPDTCYWVTPTLEEYEGLLWTKISSQAENIFPLLWDIYGLDNFNFSKKVSFLLEKNDSRLRPLDILTDFDELKNTFSPTDKGELQCYNLVVLDDSLNITCDTYSSDWNTDIVSLSDGSVSPSSRWGTSISRASSFIYFLENYKDTTFSIIDKPLTLSSIAVQSWPYTQRTTFQLVLKYVPKEDLSF